MNIFRQFFVGRKNSNDCVLRRYSAFVHVTPIAQNAALIGGAIVV
jgi:hypothetical protein